MKKILTLSIAALMVLFVSAQNLEHVFDMDELAESNGLLLSQNNPNPFNGTTDVYMAVLDPDPVTLVVADIYGHMEVMYTGSSYETGIHQFRITLKSKGTYVMGAHQNGKGSSIGMICNEGGGASRIEYLGLVEAIDPALFKAMMDEDREEDFVGHGAFKSARKVVLKDPFRMALSLSPFTLNQFEQGYSFIVGNDTAKTPKELQQIYKNLGATEMYVRVATKRHKTYNADGTLDNTTDGKKDENANAHTFDQAMEICRISKDLKMPLNPEIMCAYIYMDMDGTQAPRFHEYPDIYAMQHGKKWEELSIDEICKILEAYGKFVADSILENSYKVENWNLGNEANFGFAGIGIGTPNAFDQTLAKAGPMKRYMSSLFSVWWLKKHVWKYEVQTLAAVKRGILKAYEERRKKGLITADEIAKVKFSTHIATVVSTPRSSASFFRYMADHGYKMETAGISYYPSAPAMSFNKKKLLTKTVTRINKKCNVPVFIGEFSYPSQDMVGPFAGWNKQLGNYKKTQKGQQDVYTDVIAWGKAHGMAGIRYWAPDYEGEWYPMSMFEFKNKVGTAKSILKNHKEIAK